MFNNCWLNTKLKQVDLRAFWHLKSEIKKTEVSSNDGSLFRYRRGLILYPLRVTSSSGDGDTVSAEVAGLQLRRASRGRSKRLLPFHVVGNHPSSHWLKVCSYSPLHAGRQRLRTARATQAIAQGVGNILRCLTLSRRERLKETKLPSAHPPSEHVLLEYGKKKNWNSSL